VTKTILAVKARMRIGRRFQPRPERGQMHRALLRVGRPGSRHRQTFVQPPLAFTKLPIATARFADRRLVKAIASALAKVASPFGRRPGWPLPARSPQLARNENQASWKVHRAGREQRFDPSAKLRNSLRRAKASSRGWRHHV
jgi:hypothetical protein